LTLASGNAYGQAGGDAVITGQVSNARTRDYLEGATVSIAGTNRATATDREGRYTLTGVPDGPVTLIVSFAGLDAQRIPLTVGAGQRVVRDVELTAEIYKLDTFTVAGEREGTAKAETLQRIAPNVKAIVSSDTFGNVADGNVGDLLQHVVGITADYNGPDVRQVSIRGVGSALNSVTMDGQQVASAQSAGTGRQFEFEQASLNSIETIEVTKAPTPDMDGASIGGSVNLVTKSAFDRAAGRTITYGVGFTAQPRFMGNPAGTWKQPIDGFGPSGNFMYQDVLGPKRNLGITLTGLIHSQPVGGAIMNQAFERRADPGPVFQYSTSRIMVNGATRSRIAAGLKLDYKWSDTTMFTLNTSYNFFHENNDTRNHTISTSFVANMLATVDAGGNRTGGGFIGPDYTGTVTRVFAGPNSISNITMTSNDKSGRTILLSPRARHRFPGLEIDYSLSYSSSATYYDVSQDRPKYSSRPKGTIFYTLPNVGWIVDRSEDHVWLTLRQTEGADWNNISNYGGLRLDQTDIRGYDTVVSGKFDLKKYFSWAMPTYVKTGFTGQRQYRKLYREPRRYFYTGPDGVRGTADDTQDIAQFLEVRSRDTADEEKWFKDRGGIPPWVDPYGLAKHRQLYPEFWAEDVSFQMTRYTMNQRLEEDIMAAYVMGNVKMGPVSVLAGVRYEDTRDTGEGPLTQLTPEEIALRAAWVGPVTAAEQRRRLEAQYGSRSTNQGQYDFWLPGVHMKYEPIENFVARLSWSTGVGRPAFGSIIPNTTVNDTAETVSISNPNLLPQYAKNWDLSLEYYFRPQGMISVGAFRKDINDYIATDNSRFVEPGTDNGFDGQYVGYRIVTSRNDGMAKIEGVEANYQQQLAFLPGWAKGLGIYANYTKLWTEGNNSAFETGPGSSAGGTIAGFLAQTGNLGLGYRAFGFDLRLQTVYRGRYLTANNANAALVTWQVPKYTWNWKSRYTFRNGTGIFFDVENIFSTPLDRRYAAYEDRLISYRTFHSKIVAGVTGRF
jgi:TonB-dependent receptor